MLAIPVYCRFKVINLVQESENSYLQCSAPVINGCLNRSAAVGLFAGSLVSANYTNDLKSSLHLGLIGGGTLFTILKITLFWGSEMYGGSPSAISIANIPNDHISILVVYLRSPLINSGAIQHTVPTLLARAATSDVSQTAQPKSASLTSPFIDMRRLSDLMSRWIMFLSCR